MPCGTRKSVMTYPADGYQADVAIVVAHILIDTFYFHALSVCSRSDKGGYGQK